MIEPCSDEEMEQIRTAIFAGRKIEAIKRYRECSGAGLKEAKDFVEALEVELRQRVPEQFSATASGSGCLGMLLFPVLAIAMWKAATNL